MATTFKLNGREVTVKGPDDSPLLWAIRDELGLTGTKFGCGIGGCGACTVHLDGEPVRACVTPLSSIAGHAITTIEGLDPSGRHPLQTAWIEAQAHLKPVSNIDRLPTSKQVAFAEKLARIKRRAVPDECFRDKGLMSKWIDGNR